MTKKILFFALLFVVFYMLLIDKSEHTGIVALEEVIAAENPLISKILDTAFSYKGTGYKFGGTTVAGMDCSGLVYTAYKSIGMTLSRSSKNMYHEGEEVALSEVKKGDLLFFDIDKFEGRVNHVGLVTSINDFEVNFLHSTTSEGVIVTSINESYWKKAFIKAKRIIE